MDDKPLYDFSVIKSAIQRYADLSKPLVNPAMQEAVKRFGEQLPRFQNLEGLSAFQQNLNRSLESYDLTAVRRASENLSIVMRDYVALTLSNAKPFMSEEQLETVEEILPEISDSPDHPARKERLPLSLSDWMALLSLLLTLISFIVTQIPDAQLEQIADQNEQIKEQNEQIIEQNDEKIDLLYQLLETAQEVNDLIEDLSEEPDSAVEITDNLTESGDGFAELDKASDDLADLDVDPDNCSRLDQIDDAQQDDSSF